MVNGAGVVAQFAGQMGAGISYQDIGAGALLGPQLAKAAPAVRGASKPKQGGTMHIGIGGGGSTDDFDAAHVNGPSATTRGRGAESGAWVLIGRFP